MRLGIKCRPTTRRSGAAGLRAAYARVWPAVCTENLIWVGAV